MTDNEKVTVIHLSLSVESTLLKPHLTSYMASMRSSLAMVETGTVISNSWEWKRFLSRRNTHERWALTWPCVCLYSEFSKIACLHVSIYRYCFNKNIIYIVYIFYASATFTLIFLCVNLNLILNSAFITILLAFQLILLFEWCGVQLFLIMF